MSGISYDPPLEQLAIFDPSVFIYDQTLSSTASGGPFLNFPIAQGTETFIDLISNGTATLNTATVSNNITATTGANTNVITGTSLVLTSGATTNTLNASDWTGNIKTVNTVANTTHYLNFSNSASTGQGHPQKNASLSCNPSTATITATTFSGALSGNASSASSVDLTSDNTSGNYYLPFSKTTASSTSALFIDDTTSALTYNPFTHSVTATSFIGNASSASSVALTGDNTSGSYFIPFSKTVTSTAPLFVDNSVTPLSYNPSTSTLTATNFNGIVSSASTASNVALTSDNTSGTYFIPFSKTVTSSSQLFVDNSTTPLSYNPLTSLLTCSDFSGNLLGNATTASTASNVDLTSDNTSGAYFIPFSKTVTSSSQLFVDNSTTPLSYNPLTSRLACSEFSGDLLGNASTASISTTSIGVATTNDNANFAYNLVFCAGALATSNLLVDSVTGPLTYNPSSGTLLCSTIAADIQCSSSTTSATFVGTTLTFSGANLTLRNGSITFTGTANTVTTLSLTSNRNNAIYNIAIRNNGSLATSFLTGLGTNILTTYSATVVVPAGTSALMTIVVLTLAGISTSVVSIQLLT